MRSSWRRSHWQRGLLALLALFADTVYFLVVPAISAEPMLWLASPSFLYLLSEAVVFFGPVEVAVIAPARGSSAPSCPSRKRVRLLDRTVVVAGVLACGFAVNRRRWRRDGSLPKASWRKPLEAAEKARE